MATPYSIVVVPPTHSPRVLLLSHSSAGGASGVLFRAQEQRIERHLGREDSPVLLQPGGTVNVCFKVGNKEVCQEAMRLAYGINQSFWNKLVAYGRCVRPAKKLPLVPMVEFGPANRPSLPGLTVRLSPSAIVQEEPLQSRSEVSVRPKVAKRVCARQKA